MINPTYIITLQKFDDTQTLFRLNKIGEYSYIEKNAQEIYNDNDLLQALSSEDAYLIGYVNAEEKAFFDFANFKKINGARLAYI